MFIPNHSDVHRLSQVQQGVVFEWANLLEAQDGDAVLSFCQTYPNVEEGIRLAVYRRGEAYFAEGAFSTLDGISRDRMQIGPASAAYARNAALSWLSNVHREMIRTLSEEIERGKQRMNRLAIDLGFQLQHPDVIAASEYVDRLHTVHEIWKKRAL